jgi:hypothetical protein
MRLDEIKRSLVDVLTAKSQIVCTLACGEGRARIVHTSVAAVVASALGADQQAPQPVGPDVAADALRDSAFHRLAAWIRGRLDCAHRVPQLVRDDSQLGLADTLARPKAREGVVELPDGSPVRMTITERRT